MKTIEELEMSITDVEKQLTKVYESMKGKGRFAEPISLFNEAIRSSDIDIQPVEFSQFGGFRSLMPQRSDLPLALAGFGAASAEGIASYVKQFLPAGGLFGIDVTAFAKLIAGWLIYKFGARLHPLLSAFGGGIVISAIQDFAVSKGWYIKPQVSTNGATGGDAGNSGAASSASNPLGASRYSARIAVAQR